MRVTIFAGGVLLTLAAAASAQPAEPRLELSQRTETGQCRASQGDEVVVCADRAPSPYRIDPTVLDAIRAKEAAANPRRVQDRSGGDEPCGTVRNECSGGTVPLLEPALRIVAAGVKAIQGEDWREPFRNGPDDFRRYQDAKAKREKGSVRIGVSVTGGN